ncbi:MAG: hypothetical protein ACK2TV_11660, partial [Anaerolineales bacterium]
MTIKNGLLFLVIFLLFTSGCHIQPATPKEVLLPTTIEKATISNEIQLDIDTTNIPVVTDSLIKPETTVRETTNLVTQKPIPRDSSPDKPTSHPKNFPPIDEQINRIITQSGGRWHIIIKEVGGETIFSLLP